MKEKYEKVEVKNKEEYEKLYRFVKKQVKKVIRIYYLFCIFEIIAIAAIYIILGLIYEFNLNYGDLFALFGICIRIILFDCIGSYPWHGNLFESGGKDGRRKKLPYLFVVFLAALIGIEAIASFFGFISALILLVYLRNWWMILLIVDFGVNAVFMPLMLRYLRQYFRWYRWTWEELQLPLEERKAQYRAKKLEEKQKRRAEREAKREAKKKESTASGGAGFFSKNSAQPAAKTVKTQADRRAELENLKKLYDEGLIDEEEYKKARKKALGI